MLRIDLEYNDLTETVFQKLLCLQVLKRCEAGKRTIFSYIQEWIFIQHPASSKRKKERERIIRTSTPHSAHRVCRLGRLLKNSGEREESLLFSRWISTRAGRWEKASEDKFAISLSVKKLKRDEKMIVVCNIFREGEK